MYVSHDRMSDFINKMFTISLHRVKSTLILILKVKLLSDRHGDSLALKFYRARICNYIMMTLCHYSNVII